MRQGPILFVIAGSEQTVTSQSSEFEQDTSFDFL